AGERPARLRRRLAPRAVARGVVPRPVREPLRAGALHPGRAGGGAVAAAAALVPAPDPPARNLGSRPVPGLDALAHPPCLPRRGVAQPGQGGNNAGPVHGHRALPAHQGLPRLSRAVFPASVRFRRRGGGRSAKAMTVLDDILAAKRDEVAARRAATPPSALRERPLYAEPRRGFRAALAARKRPAIIAELKRASPSRGEMRAAYDPAAIACGYAAAGAAALSVLTDGPFFGGALEHLAAARAASGLPCLRKDFLIDPYQIDEARAFGADAVLLIVAAVTAGQGADLLAAARAAGLDVLVEVHSEAELERAAGLGATLIGINNRDLATFDVSLATAERLA